MKIKINNLLLLSGTNSKTILATVKEQGYTIKHSCLSGRCSECKARVVTGEFEMPITQDGLSEQEVENGYCLTCVTKPLTDMELEKVSIFEGILPEVKTFPVKISSIERLSDNVVKITLRTPPNKCLEFISGQYVDLSIKGIKRSYSIASTPFDSAIELIIKNYPNGQFSNYLFHEARVDDLLRLEGPKGTYILPKEIPQNLLFVSTGTGIAPNLSLIRSAVEGGVGKSQITLIHGQRRADDHVYSLAENLSDIDIILATSRESAKGFYHGYVQGVINELDINFAETMVFACGNPRMISDLKMQMVEKGLREKNFKSDVFVPSN